MYTRSEGGFTIIEVMIFLAITALMITIAIAGLGSKIASVRFTDSVRSFESFMQRQYDETLNGVNVRPGNETCKDTLIIDKTMNSVPGMSNECLLLGKFIYLEKNNSRIRVYQVVGIDPEDLADDDGDAVAIEKSKPHIVQDVAVEDYDIPWGADVYDTRRDDGSPSGTAINTVLMLRSPKSSAIYTYTFAVSGSPDSMSSDITSYVATSTNLGRQTNICVQSQDVVPVFGAVSITQGGRGQDSISSRLDIDDGNKVSLCEGA